jgi:endonuclease YncB( thermonuclease family)
MAMNNNTEGLKLRLNLTREFIGLVLVAVLIGCPTVAVAKNVYVTDGDTIHVDGTTYRLEGIDAPETKQSCNDEFGKTFRCGLQATRMLRQLIAQGSVHCDSSGKDRYGRQLGHCFAGGIDVNGEMVAKGFARAFIKYSSEYIADESDAMYAHRGLWAGQWQAPWDWRADQLTANNPMVGQCVIKGNIGKRGRIYYMPFHSSYSRVKIDLSNGERWFCTEGEAMVQGWRRAD